MVVPRCLRIFCLEILINSSKWKSIKQGVNTVMQSCNMTENITFLHNINRYSFFTKAFIIQTGTAIYFPDNRLLITSVIVPHGNHTPSLHFVKLRPISCAPHFRLVHKLCDCRGWSICKKLPSSTNETVNVIASLISKLTFGDCQFKTGYHLMIYFV